MAIGSGALAGAIAGLARRFPRWRPGCSGRRCRGAVALLAGGMAAGSPMVDWVRGWRRLVELLGASRPGVGGLRLPAGVPTAVALAVAGLASAGAAAGAVLATRARHNRFLAGGLAALAGRGGVAGSRSGPRFGPCARPRPAGRGRRAGVRPRGVAAGADCSPRGGPVRGVQRALGTRAPLSGPGLLLRRRTASLAVVLVACWAARRRSPAVVDDSPLGTRRGGACCTAPPVRRASGHLERQSPLRALGGDWGRGRRWVDCAGARSGPPSWPPVAQDSRGVAAAAVLALARGRRVLLASESEPARKAAMAAAAL